MIPDDTIMVCAGCGSENSIYEWGNSPHWRDVRVVTKDGNAHVREHGRWEEANLGIEAERNYGCSTEGCQYQDAQVSLTAIARPKPHEDDDAPPAIEGQESLGV